MKPTKIWVLALFFSLQWNFKSIPCKLLIGIFLFHLLPKFELFLCSPVCKSWWRYNIFFIKPLYRISSQSRQKLILQILSKNIYSFLGNHIITNRLWYYILIFLLLGQEVGVIVKCDNWSPYKFLFNALL